MSRTPFDLTRAGHVHVEMVERTDIRPGFRRWYVQTEQKRPDVLAFAIDQDLTVLLSSVEGTLYLRDDEDGSKTTDLRLRLPRPLPWREWTVLAEPDKWGCTVIAFTTSWPARPSFRMRIRVRGYLHRIFYRRSPHA